MGIGSYTVSNSARVTLERGHRLFPPRSETTVALSDAELREVRACVHLTVRPAGKTAGQPRSGREAAESGQPEAFAHRAALVARAKELGIPAKGKNADLEAAIVAAEAASADSGGG